MNLRIVRLLSLPTGVIALVALLFWPDIRFRIALAQLSVSTSGVPEYAGATTASFGADTFSDNVSSGGIGNLYYAACNRLEHLRGDYPRRTYHWYDLEGWDRVTSVVQFPTGHISVTAANNNDNDSVDVRVAPGKFPPPNHSPHQFLELKELPNDRLPASTLRYQQRGSAGPGVNAGRGQPPA